VSSQNDGQETAPRPRTLVLSSSKNGPTSWLHDISLSDLREIGELPYVLRKSRIIVSKMSSSDQQMISPLVSVIMPAHNAELYVLASIHSVLEQTMPSFELLVIDDGSTDSTVQLVESYITRDARVRLIKLWKNTGAPAAPRNIGVREARGRWVAFLDSDDIWHPLKLEVQLGILAQTGARFCSTQIFEFTHDYPLDASNLRLQDFEWVSFLRQLIKFRTPTSSVIVDLQLLLSNPFNEDVKYKAREDLDCWLRCHEVVGKSVKIRAPLTGYRINPGQISGNKLSMVFRHYHVLSKYRFKSGRKLGKYAIIFTATHFILSVYYRKFRKKI